MGYIYKISNTINNKIYIGQTVKKRPTDRFSQHRYEARHLSNNSKHVSILHEAMAKYGVDNFLFEIIEEVENNLLDEREQYWICYYNSITPNGYNITKGGNGTKGYSREQSIEERLKRQQSNKQYFINHPEAIEKYKEQTRALWQNKEYAEKVKSGIQNYHKNNPNAFSGENNPFFGQQHTEETKQKLKQSAQKYKKKIAQIDKETLEIIQVFDGIRDAENAIKASHGWLSKAAKSNKIAYGYYWKFI